MAEKILNEVTPEEKGWKWYVGHSEEVYTYGPFNSKDEALEAAIANEAYFITEAYKKLIVLGQYFELNDLWPFWENIKNKHEEVFGCEHDAYDPLKNIALGGLEQYIQKAMIQWQKDKGLEIIPFYFTETRNSAKVIF